MFIISTSICWMFSELTRIRFDLEQESFEKLEYEVLEIYDGLPTYRWDAQATESMESFQCNANYYNDYLFGTLHGALREKLQLDPRQIRQLSHSRRERYWTQRVRRLIAGGDIGFVQAWGLVLPLVIPMALQTCIEEMRYRYHDIPDTALSNVLVPVHDPSRYRPATAGLPSTPRHLG